MGRRSHSRSRSRSRERRDRDRRRSRDRSNSRDRDRTRRPRSPDRPSGREAGLPSMPPPPPPDFRGPPGQDRYQRDGPGGGGRGGGYGGGYGGYGGGGGSHYRPTGDPSGPPDSDDEELMAKSGGGGLAEFRRLKRVRLGEKKKQLLWRVTPSPPYNYREPTPLSEAEEEEGPGGKKAAAGAGAGAGGAEGPNPEEPGAPPSVDPTLCDADYEELDAFRRWIEAQNEAEVQIQRARETAAAAAAADIVGPTLPTEEGQGGASHGYGLHLRPGEGERMAEFIKQNKRIPRRGEIALAAEEIARYEDLGYVMSGSRHARMNAIRIRKENQVYTAEEKAALAMINFEEKKAKEEKILADMKRLVEQRLGSLPS